MILYMFKIYLNAHLIFSLADNPAQDRPQPLRQGLQRHGRRSKVAEKVSLPPFLLLFLCLPFFAISHGDKGRNMICLFFSSPSFWETRPRGIFRAGGRNAAAASSFPPSPPPIQAPKNLSLTLRRIDVRDRRRRLSPPSSFRLS